MKILELGSSGVQADRIPGVKLAHEIAASMLQKALGDDYVHEAISNHRQRQ